MVRSHFQFPELSDYGKAMNAYLSFVFPQLTIRHSNEFPTLQISKNP